MAGDESGAIRGSPGPYQALLRAGAVSKKVNPVSLKLVSKMRTYNVPKTLRMGFPLEGLLETGMRCNYSVVAHCRAMRCPGESVARARSPAGVSRG